MLEIQSIAIELADARGSDDDSMRVLQREDIQGSVDGIAERLFFFKHQLELSMDVKYDMVDHTVVSLLSGAEFHMSM